jgi:iron complex transport system substrate-binding protein
MRIVSMLSSATEIVHALGLGDRLVAISHECDYPPGALRLPRASRTRFDPAGLSSAEIDAAVRRCMEEHGSVYEVDRERLRELRPDLVLTQAVCEVCAVPTGSVLEAVGALPHPPRVLSLDAHTLEGIVRSHGEVAEAAGVPGRGEEAEARLRARLERVAARVAGRPRPRVLMLEWLDPPFAPGHWVPEMVELAGGENLVGSAGARSREVAWEALEGADPDVLLVEPCGYALAEARADAERSAARLLSLAPRAVREGRAWLLHSAFYSRSGPRVVEGVEVLARVLHPGLFPEVELHGRAERWR